MVQRIGVNLSQKTLDSSIKENARSLDYKMTHIAPSGNVNGMNGNYRGNVSNDHNRIPIKGDKRRQIRDTLRKT